MAKINKKPDKIHTHEGGIASHINPEQQLRRSVMSCMLWEREFYEEGETIADRIISTIPKVKPEKVAQIAIEARTNMKLRHVPLLIVREMARLDKYKPHVAATLESVIQRPDELTEFLAIYWKDSRQPLSAQVKKGLARAFVKFSPYQLAKYNRDGQVKLKDVLFLCHAKPANKEQESTWKQLIEGTLTPPDTWEVNLSTGKGKKETWTRLIEENKLGGLAMLRNLRNMGQVNLSDDLICQGISQIKHQRILPFRFIAAARYAPRFELALERKLFECVQERPKLSGKTVILVDVSGSMDDTLSHKSDMMRMDAACGVSMVLRELCADCAIFSFSEHIVEIPTRRGFALRDAIVTSQRHWSTYLGKALKKISGSITYDRIVVITDEQSHDSVPDPINKGYMINVASARNGVGYGKWTHINGFSEAVIDYMIELEQSIQQ